MHLSFVWIDPKIYSCRDFSINTIVLSKESPHSHNYLVRRISWKTWNPQEQEDIYPEKKNIGGKKSAMNSGYSRAVFCPFLFTDWTLKKFFWDV